MEIAAEWPDSNLYHQSLTTPEKRGKLGHRKTVWVIDFSWGQSCYDMWHVDHHRLFMHNKPPLTVTVARGVCVSVHKKTHNWSNNIFSICCHTARPRFRQTETLLRDHKKPKVTFLPIKVNIREIMCRLVNSLCKYIYMCIYMLDFHKCFGHFLPVPTALWSTESSLEVCLLALCNIIYISIYYTSCCVHLREN